MHVARCSVPTARYTRSSSFLSCIPVEKHKNLYITFGLLAIMFIILIAVLHSRNRNGDDDDGGIRRTSSSSSSSVVTSDSPMVVVPPPPPNTGGAAPCTPPSTLPLKTPSPPTAPPPSTLAPPPPPRTPTPPIVVTTPSPTLRPLTPTPTPTPSVQPNKTTPRPTPMPTPVPTSSTVAVNNSSNSTIAPVVTTALTPTPVTDLPTTSTPPSHTEESIPTTVPTNTSAPYQEGYDDDLIPSAVPITLSAVAAILFLSALYALCRKPKMTFPTTASKDNGTNQQPGDRRRFGLVGGGDLELQEKAMVQTWLSRADEVVEDLKDRPDTYESPILEQQPPPTEVGGVSSPPPPPPPPPPPLLLSGQFKRPRSVSLALPKPQQLLQQLPTPPLRSSKVVVVFPPASPSNGKFFGVGASPTATLAGGGGRPRRHSAVSSRVVPEDFL